MWKSKVVPDNDLSLRLKVTLGGVARVLGIGRSACYWRVRNGVLNMDGIPCDVLRTGTFYDLEAVFKRFLPGVNDHTRGLLMYDFIQDNGRVVK